MPRKSPRADPARSWPPSRPDPTADEHRRRAGPRGEASDEPPRILAEAQRIGREADLSYHAHRRALVAPPRPVDRRAARRRPAVPREVHPGRRDARPAPDPAERTVAAVIIQYQQINQMGEGSRPRVNLLALAELLNRAARLDFLTARLQAGGLMPPGQPQDGEGRHRGVTRSPVGPDPQQATSALRPRQEMTDDATDDRDP